ncbi:MAG: hypothetical protein Kow0069_23880 [Promethearchaeota archaeon]
MELNNEHLKAHASRWRTGRAKALAKRGLYEVWFVMVHDVERAEAYWLRYTLLVPKVKLESETLDAAGGVSALWFAKFAAGDPSRNFVVKKSFPLSACRGTPASARPFEGQEILQVGDRDATLCLGAARASFSTPAGRKVAWDLSFDHFLPPYKHVPLLAKLLRISTTIPVTTHPNLSVTGTIEVDGESRNLTGVPGNCTHITGLRYSEPWVWAHCNAFEGNPGAWLALSGKAGKMTLAFHDGQAPYLFNGISALRAVSYESSLTRVVASAKRKDCQLRVEVEVPREALIGVEYAGPVGERMWCYNSEVASAKVEVTDLGANGGRAMRRREFTSSASTAFETTWLEPLESLPALAWEAEDAGDAEGADAGQ